MNRPGSQHAAPQVSVVIPALNEALNLPHVLPRIPRDVHEVILVDGASIDETVEVARSLLPSIKIVTETRRGKGTALCAGFQAATGNIIVMLDADGSTDPAEIPRFVDALLRGADFAKGSRFLTDGGSTDLSRLRAFGNRGFVTLVRLLFGGRYTDLCYGYNAFWTSVLPVLALDGSGFEIETMMNVRALRNGLRISEVASFERSRVNGVSNLRTFRDGWRVLRTIVLERLSPRRGITTWNDRGALAARSVEPFADVPRLHLVPVMDDARAGQLDLAFGATAFAISSLGDLERAADIPRTETAADETRIAAFEPRPVRHLVPVMDIASRHTPEPVLDDPAPDESDDEPLVSYAVARER
jgi:hypothetical protein